MIMNKLIEKIKLRAINRKGSGACLHRNVLVVILNMRDITIQHGIRLKKLHVQLQD